MNPSPEDIRIGRMAALEDLIATCDTDLQNCFQRHDLTPEQNQEMCKELGRLWLELSQRRIDLICHKNLQPA